MPHLEIMQVETGIKRRTSVISLQPFLLGGCDLMDNLPDGVRIDSPKAISATVSSVGSTVVCTRLTACGEADWW